MFENQIDPVVNTLIQIHDGKTHIGEYLNLVFKYLPIAICWKNSESVYEGCNHIQAKILGASHPDEVVGKNNFEVDMSEDEAILFRADDQKVLTSQKPSLNDLRSIHYTSGRSTTVSVTKIPLYNDDKEIINLVSFSYEIASSNKFKGLSSTVYDFCQQDISKDKNHYYLIANDQTIRLTGRQAEVLTHLSMGKTVKQIANLLDCAQSTIEDHIDRLKQKLEAYSTSTLIDYFWTNPIKWF